MTQNDEDNDRALTRASWVIVVLFALLCVCFTRSCSLSDKLDIAKEDLARVERGMEGRLQQASKQGAASSQYWNHEMFKESQEVRAEMIQFSRVLYNMLDYEQRERVDRRYPRAVDRL